MSEPQSVVWVWKRRLEHLEMLSSFAAAGSSSTVGRSDDFPVKTDVSWEDRSWRNGALNRHSVLDYFSHSQFFDPASVNAQLQMQRNQLTPDAIQRLLAEELGIIYKVDDNRVEELPPDPPEKPNGDPNAHSLYVICKLLRTEEKYDRGKRHRCEKMLRYYYVLDGVVYEAPTLAAVVQVRLKRLGWYLSEAFDAARKAAETSEDGVDAPGGGGTAAGGGRTTRSATPIPGPGPSAASQQPQSKRQCTERHV